MSEPVRIGPPPLNGLHLAAGAWRAMQANARPLLLIGLVDVALSLAAERAAVALKVTTPALTPEFIGYTAVGGALGAVISGLVVRLLLVPEGPRWRIDGRLAAYVLATVAIGLVLNLLMAGYMSVMPTDVETAADPGPAAGRALVLLMALLVGMWAWLRLTLWPVGLLLGDRSLTVGRAFQLMRRGVLGVILAALILGVGPLIVYMVLAMQAQSQPWALVIAAPFLAFATLAWAAVQAEAYRQRMAAGPRGVASAFD
jgi:hypothetical protein